MQAWTIVAVANDQMNKAGEADSAFRKALSLNWRLPRFDANAAYEYLKVLERDHRDKEAHEIMTGILKRSPGYGPAHLSLAKELAAAGKDSEAVKEGEFALARSQGDRVVERDTPYLLARLDLRLNRTDRAELHKKWLDESP